MKSIARFMFLSVFSLLAILTDHAVAGGFDDPISNKVIQAQVVLPSGESVEFEVREGTKLEIENSQTGEHLAFSPLIDTSTATIHWLPMRVTASGELTPVQPPAELALGIWHDFEITLNGVQATYSVSASGVVPRLVPDPPERCCVTCDEWTICGVSVNHYCGSCP